MAVPLFVRTSANASAIESTFHPSLASYFTDRFFVEYDRTVETEKLPAHVQVLPALMNVAPVVWVSGKEFEVAEIDGQTLAALDSIREVFRAMYPNTPWTGKITARQIVDDDTVGPESSGAGILFSGGVDSVCTAYRNRAADVTLITIQGADVSLRNEEGWQAASQSSAQFAHSNGFQYASIRSNLRDFLYYGRLNNLSPEVRGWWAQVQHGMGLTGLALPLLWARRLPILHIAASHTSDFRQPWGSNPQIDNLIACGGLRVHHDGFELSRQAKVASIVEQKGRGLFPSLRVCAFDPTPGALNCGRCEKCLRTMNGLIAAGETDIMSYGFPLGWDQVAARTRSWVKTHRLAITTPNEVFMWKDIQGACTPQGSTPLGKYQEWLRRVDFSAYQRVHRIVRLPKTVVARVLARNPAALRAVQRLQLKIQRRFDRPSGYK